MTAILRARRAINDAGIAGQATLQRVPSMFNEVWMYGDSVVRVSGTPGSRRLAYECQLSKGLPPEVMYPKVLAYGRTEFGEWMVQRKVEGVLLAEAWPTLSDTDRERAVNQLGGMLKAVHASPPPSVNGATIVPPFLEGDGLECPHQLPVDRMRTVIAKIADRKDVDEVLLRQAAAFVREHGDAIDDPKSTRIIHGDVHFSNVLWNNGLVGLLDFEWSRPAPIDVDLDVLLRICADPELHVSEHLAKGSARQAYSKVPMWLNESYPELFAHPRLVERLELYALSYDLRDWLFSPPLRAGDQKAEHHATNRIKRIIDGRSHARWLTW